MRGRINSAPGTHPYVRACVALARTGEALRGRGGSFSKPEDASELSHALDLSNLPIGSDTVLGASRAAALVVGCAFAGASAVCMLVFGLKDSLLLILMTIIAPLLVGELVKSYPRMLSRKIASEGIKDSTGAIRLMVMSLRREPKAAVNALITASCEATEDGRRRALDRANNASVLGVKRRIEEYALSLSTPSMVMFGLAILLPLMVGSLLPMLSWDVWTASSGAIGPNMGTSPIGMPQVAFIMNVMFPAIGLLVAMSSVTRHPLESRDGRPALTSRTTWRLIAPSVCCTILFVTLATIWLEGIQRAAAILIGSAVPTSILLLYLGRRGPDSTRGDQEASEEVLFRTGARMVEGENFESAICEACKGQDGAPRADIEGR